MSIQKDEKQNEWKKKKNQEMESDAVDNRNLPLISVIVPAYNVEQYLGECVESILHQTYRNLEILLIDDGSTDRTGELCDLYAKADSRVKVIHKENGGLSDARNAALDVCMGEYITCVDGDDFIDLTMIEYLYDMITEKDADMAIINSYRYQNRVEFKYSEGQTETMMPEEALRRMLTEQKCNVSAWGKLYKKELFETIRYPKGRLYEDLFVITYLIEQCKKIVYNQKSMYYYRVNNVGISKGKFTENHLDLLYASRDVVKFVKQKYPKLESVAIARYVRYAGNTVRSILESDYRNKKLERKLSDFIRKNIVYVMQSDYKISIKFFAVLSAYFYVELKVCYWILKSLKKLWFKLYILRNINCFEREKKDE